MAAIALAITSSSTGIPVGDEREWGKGEFSELFLERKRKIYPQIPNRFPFHPIDQNCSRTAEQLQNCCYVQPLKHLLVKGYGKHDCHERLRLAIGY